MNNVFLFGYVAATFYILKELLLGVVHDGVESVCDGENRAVLKLAADGGLD